MSEHRVRVEVNGDRHELTVEARLKLTDLLRDRLGLTATHLGCERGVCGACTVLLDDVPVRSCLVLAVQADGSSVVTLEGLPDGDPVRTALHEEHALQCGFCTPGIVLSLWHLVNREGATAADARAALEGHTCRCTGYVHLQRAVDRVVPA
ncbi:(2Fe-2S)-binding protein [Amycolatopsis sp. cmx-4-83]|uniref:(2Fe-2S)-binding protein n=1 Tax=Amycolatopsis sp. cmx-4-83 TaxID=2790940 RepID=UPI00397C0C99